jgi:hypothetical protein
LHSPEGEVIKLNLVIKNWEEVFMVNMTVCHEDGDYLQMGRESKIDKYAQLLPDLHQRLNSETGEVLPIVIKTRGALPKHTIKDQISRNYM